MSKSTIRATIGGRIIAFYPVLARIAGSVSGGVWLSQLLYWDNQMAEVRGDDWDGWFYKSGRSFRLETQLTRYEMEQARDALVANGIIYHQARGVPMTSWYHVNFDALEQAIEVAEQEMVKERRDHKSKDTPPQFADLRQTENADGQPTGLPNASQLDCLPSANKNADSQQAIHYITQEITQESTEKGDPESFSEAMDCLLEALNLSEMNGDSGKFAQLWNDIPEPQLYRKARDAINGWASFSKNPRVYRQYSIFENTVRRFYFARLHDGRPHP